MDPVISEVREAILDIIEKAKSAPENISEDLKLAGDVAKVRKCTSFVLTKSAIKAE